MKAKDFLLSPWLPVVGQFRQALRTFYDGGYKTIWVLFGDDLCKF